MEQSYSSPVILLLKAWAGRCMTESKKREEESILGVGETPLSFRTGTKNCGENRIESTVGSQISLFLCNIRQEQTQQYSERHSCKHK